MEDHYWSGERLNNHRRDRSTNAFIKLFQQDRIIKMTQDQKVITPRAPAEATEDYLEMINELIQTKGFASVSDIAERMNVAKASATSIIKKLNKEEYVVHER